MILIAPKVVIARATWRASAGIPSFAIPVLQAVLEVNTEIHLSAPEPRTHGTSCRHTKHHPKQSTKVMAGVRVMLPYMERSVLRSAPAVWLSRSLSLAHRNSVSAPASSRPENCAHTNVLLKLGNFAFSNCVFGLLGPRCVRAMASYPCNSCDCSFLLTLSAISRITSF